MSNEEFARLSEPRVDAFEDPSSAVACEPAVLAVWNDDFDALLLQSLAQWVGVAGAIRDHAPGCCNRRATFFAGAKLLPYRDASSHGASFSNVNLLLLAQQANQTTRLKQKSPASGRIYL